jgi:hypothetical protein
MLVPPWTRGGAHYTRHESRRTGGDNQASSGAPWSSTQPDPPSSVDPPRSPALAVERGVSHPRDSAGAPVIFKRHAPESGRQGFHQRRSTPSGRLTAGIGAQSRCRCHMDVTSCHPRAENAGAARARSPRAHSSRLPQSASPAVIHGTPVALKQPE